MSRHGYTDDPWDDDHANIRAINWAGAVASATRGKRGQAFLRAPLAALDAMPVKRLVVSQFEENGEFCALGVLGKSRGIEFPTLDEEDDDELDHEWLGAQFDIAAPLAQHVMYVNDEFSGEYERAPSGYQLWTKQPVTPESRWQAVRDWVASKIIVTADELLPMESE